MAGPEVLQLAAESALREWTVDRRAAFVEERASKVVVVDDIEALLEPE